MISSTKLDFFLPGMLVSSQIKIPEVHFHLYEIDHRTGILMASFRTLAPLLFGLHDGEPRDKNDSVQAQTATCERLMQWEFLSSSRSGQHHSVEKYRWSHR